MDKVPDRWLNYKPIGNHMSKTPFVAFKCPLKSEILRNVPTREKFGLDDLKSMYPNVKLIIDLTNTDRYYNSDVVRKLGIDYEKFKIPGRVVPSSKLINRFFEVVDNFRKKYPDAGTDDGSLIGVHCTHGVNRTGFFICCYLMNRMGYTYKAAVNEFRNARGHKIERDVYLNALKAYESKPGYSTRNNTYNHTSSFNNPSFHHNAVPPLTSFQFPPASHHNFSLLPPSTIHLDMAQYGDRFSTEHPYRGPPSSGNYRR